MMRNPVFSREIKVGSRSVRLPLIILLFNGTLSLVTLLNMYSAVAQVKTTAVIQYSSFMNMYEFVTTIEFILLMFIVPAVTAASISGAIIFINVDLPEPFIPIIPIFAP